MGVRGLKCRRHFFYRAGMLETFLKEPTALTDDDVMELLLFIFRDQAVQQKLDMLIENRKKVGEMEVE